MATPPIVANTDFSQWQSWPTVSTPAGDQTYYVVPGYNGQYVFDPYTSDATGRITIYQNPAPLYEAEKKAREQQEEQGSSGSQLAGVAGTAAGAGTAYLAAQYFGNTAPAVSSGISAGAGAGAGGAGGAGAGGAAGGSAAGGTAAGGTAAAPVATSTAAAPVATSTAAPAATGSAATGTAATGQAISQTSASAPQIAASRGAASASSGGGSAATTTSSGGSAASNAAPYASYATLLAALWMMYGPKIGEKYIGKPIMSAADKTGQFLGINELRTGKEATPLLDEQVYQSQEFEKQFPELATLTPDVRNKFIQMARDIGLVGGAKTDNPKEWDPVVNQKEWEALKNVSGGVAPRPPHLEVARTFDPKHVAEGMGSQRNSFDESLGSTLLQYGAAPIYKTYRGQKTNVLDGRRMYELLPFEQQLQVNLAEREKGTAQILPKIQDARYDLDSIGKFIEAVKGEGNLAAGLMPTATTPGTPQNGAPAIQTTIGPTTSLKDAGIWNEKSLENLSKDDMAAMLAAMMEGQAPKGIGQQVQNVPARSSTLSPGIDKNGNRISY